MADAKKNVTIIIKKIKKGGHGGHHGGAWKVAYADFVTAMMCFFMVMWLMGADEETKASIANYFNNPTAAWRPELKDKDNIPLGNQTGAGDSVLKGAGGQVPEDIVKDPTPVVERTPNSVAAVDLAGIVSLDELSAVESMTFAYPEEHLFIGDNTEIANGKAQVILDKIGKIARSYQGKINIRAGFGNTADSGSYEIEMSRVVRLKQHLVGKRLKAEELVSVNVNRQAPFGENASDDGVRKIYFTFSKSQ